MQLFRLRSSYLVSANLSSGRQSTWRGFNSQILSIRKANPHILPRTLVALMIWGSIASGISYLTTPHQTADQSPVTRLQASLSIGGSLVTSASPTREAAADVLPDGPTGQLLPPGSMAPDRSFRNSYAPGQCTWYVAGRRQIPGGWGNAAHWYYAAASSGWSVGTTPAVAAIAWTPSGYYGHVALVEQVSPDGSQIYLSEMNYRGTYIKSYRWTSASSFKYIY